MPPTRRTPRTCRRARSASGSCSRGGTRRSCQGATAQPVATVVDGESRGDAVCHIHRREAGAAPVSGAWPRYAIADNGLPARTARPGEDGPHVARRERVIGQARPSVGPVRQSSITRPARDVGRPLQSATAARRHLHLHHRSVAVVEAVQLAEQEPTAAEITTASQVGRRASQPPLRRASRGDMPSGDRSPTNRVKNRSPRG